MLHTRKSTRADRMLFAAAARLSLGLFLVPLQAQSLDVSPDITVVLGGVTVNDEDVAEDDLIGGISLIDVGPLPAGVDTTGVHSLANGEEVLALDTTVALPGLPGLGTAFPGDVVRYDGAGNYTLEFDSVAAGLPDGVRTDAVTIVDGNLLLSFDITVDLGGFTADDEDLVRWDGASFNPFLDGSVAGIPEELDLDGVHYEETGNLLISLDGSGTVDGVPFDDEDVLEYDPLGNSWVMAYDGSVEHAGWSAADLDAVSRMPPVPCVDDLAARPKSGQVTLTWTHTGAESYNVYGGTTEGGPYNFVANTTSTYSTYTETGLVNDTTYYYVVVEVIEGEEICQSNEASATPAGRRRR